MATHFICQSTEPLPHVYPTGLPKKSHGAVSQYEVYNESNKAHTQFPPPGWDFSQTSEEDSLPLLQPLPQPEWKNSSFHPDPNLCITPQKTKTQNSVICHTKKPIIDPDPVLTLTPEKSLIGELISNKRIETKANDKGRKQRVRFEMGENTDDWLNEDMALSKNLNSRSSKKMMSDKPYQPELYGDDDDNFELKDSPESGETSETVSGSSRTVKYTVGKVNNQPVYIPLQENEYTINEDGAKQSQTAVPNRVSKTSIPQNKGIAVKSVKVVREKSIAVEQGLAKSESDPIAASRVPEKNGPKRKAKVLRENQYGPQQTEYTFPFNQNAFENDKGEEHMFARPEYNSTLRMKLEAEKLKASTVDIEYALQKKLNVSETTKTEINEKAAALVNTGGSAYSGLVSLTLPADQICKEAAELKTARAKQVKVTKSKNKDHHEPDLMEFFTNERQKESMTFTLPGISVPSEQLSTASNWRAFDLYKHNRVWEGRGSKI